MDVRGLVWRSPWDKLSFSGAEIRHLGEQLQPGGSHTVQLLRTSTNLRRRRDHPYARGGERSVARGCAKALARADELVSVEDQHLGSAEVAQASRVPQELGRDQARRRAEF